MSDQPQAASVYCSECGTQQPAGSRFCSNCGAPLATAEQPTEAVDASRLRPQEQQTAPQPAPKKRNIWVMGCLAMVGVFLLCGFIGALVSDGDDQAAIADPSPPSEVVAEVSPPVEAEPSPAPTPEPTPEPVPTDPPPPTPEPEPTAPPPPTNTPEPTVPPEPTSPPPPVELSGAGQFVTESLTPPGPFNRISFTHQGQANFAVWIYDETNEQDLLVNTIGNYSGSRPLFGTGEYRFEIDADGPWTVRIEALTEDPAAAQGIEGSGDYVSGLFMPAQTGPVPHQFTHNGQGNFAVWLHCIGGTDLLQNEIGAVDGSSMVQFSEGPCVWEVTADGAWSIRPLQ